MPDFDLVIRAPRAILAEPARVVAATSPGGYGENRQVSACIGVRDGRIAMISSYDADPSADRLVELGDDVVLLPGLVDTHVHINEPGRTEWEGFATATRAAAAGGVTTIIDMPLNSIPPTVDVAALDAKRDAAHRQCHVDVGFWGGAVPSNLGSLYPLQDAGVFGFKCFLVDSGVDEFQPLDDDGMRTALGELAGFGGLLLVHAEDQRVISASAGSTGSRPERYADFLASRPGRAERVAVDAVISATRDTESRSHIVHLADPSALPALRAARRDGVRISVETCPHYLSFVAEEILDGATQFKCCPPIRDTATRELLWAGLLAGDIDCVVSDHSPSAPELKRMDTGDFSAAWGGISSLQLGLPAVWTGARQRGADLADVVEWMARRPADLVGLRHKGRIAVGCDADLLAFAPDETFVVDPTQLRHRHQLTPYAGVELSGIVRETWVRGRETDGDPRGQLLERGVR